MTPLQTRIYEILLLPIDVYTRRKKDIVLSDNDGIMFIKSAMRYIPPNSKSAGALDWDVSDIAIKFYEAIYSKSPILREDRRPLSDQFIGDTMNTSNKDGNYHCLSNFWLLPMKLSRTLSSDSKANKGVAGDSVPKFLKYLKANYSSYERNYPDYFNHFGNFETFCKKHFIEGVYSQNGAILEVEEHDDLDKLLRKRAESIAIEKTEELKQLFFDELNLDKKA